MKILAEWFHVREFAVMTGILMAIGGMGSLIAATPLAWLSAGIGWRFSLWRSVFSRWFWPFWSISSFATDRPIWVGRLRPEIGNRVCRRSV